MKTILKILGGAFAAILLYVLVGIVVSNYIIPAERPDLTNYFRPGDKLVSRFEGFDQTVLGTGDRWMHTRLVVRPYAAGPPEHFHEAFPETFTVKSGTLSVLVDGQKRVLHAGQTISIPPLTRHKPFNETDQPVVVEGDEAKTLPIQFGYTLSQLYGVMDSQPDAPTTWQIVMQLAVYGNDADTWIADGPSLPVQKAMRFTMAPTARLLGYKSYYPEYRPSRN